MVCAVKQQSGAWGAAAPSSSSKARPVASSSCRMEPPHREHDASLAAVAPLGADEPRANCTRWVVLVSATWSEREPGPTPHQPALLQRHARVPTRWAHLPPLSQQIEHLGRQHYVPILAALDCSMRIILCALSICLTFNRTTSLARRPPP